MICHGSRTRVLGFIAMRARTALPLLTRMAMTITTGITGTTAQVGAASTWCCRGWTRRPLRSARSSARSTS